jgi:hypothetical protein
MTLLGIRLPITLWITIVMLIVVFAGILNDWAAGRAANPMFTTIIQFIYVGIFAALMVECVRLRLEVKRGAELDKELKEGVKELAEVFRNGKIEAVVCPRCQFRIPFNEESIIGGIKEVSHETH